MKFWFDTLRSRMLLTLVTYALYLLLYQRKSSMDDVGKNLPKGKQKEI